MTATVLDIYNAAISAVRGRARLQSLSDRNRSREECDIWYTVTRNIVQEAAFWPACRRLSRLTLLSTRDENADWQPDDPDPQFKYLYGLPSDYLRAWHMVDYSRFSLTFNASFNRVTLSTNMESPILVYAAVQDNPAFWTEGQKMATIQGLAAAIASPLNASNGLQQLAMQTADAYIVEAQIASANQSQAQLDVIPETLRVRGYEDYREEKYFYPFGPTFNQALTNVN